MTETTLSNRLAEAITELRDAQKSSRGAAAYSRFINRPLGRVFAALAHVAGLSPNVVTIISGCVTFSGIAVLVTVSPTWWSSLLTSTLLVLGYALDSADGQVARLQKRSSLEGEWLDHIVDALKMASIHTAVLVSWYRFSDLATSWLIVPIVAQITASVFFFGLILTDLLRRIHLLQKPGAELRRNDGSKPTSMWYSLAVLPSDYGFLCIMFVTLWIKPVFTTVYTLVTLMNVLLFSAAVNRWFRDVRSLK